MKTFTSVLMPVVSALAVIACFATTVRQSQAQSLSVSVNDFGAIGDGVADDYVAMKAAAVYLCAHPGSALVYPAGTYRVGVYRVDSSGGKEGGTNGVTSVVYDGCRDVTISGFGAKIDVKGDFNRAVDPATVSDGFAQSKENGVIPFAMKNSVNFVIEGFELDGNVDLMTRDTMYAGEPIEVAEGNNGGIVTTNSQDYMLRDLYIHHFHTDGLWLGANSVLADQRATVQRVKSYNNARQGLSIIQVNGASITESEFSNTGRTGGSYGWHLPGAGADVEPNRAGPPNGQEDLWTTNIVFDRVRFEENLGEAQFICDWPERVQSVTVQNSYIKAEQNATLAAAFLNNARYAMTQGNTFDLGLNTGVLLGSQTAKKYLYLVNQIVQNNTFNVQNIADIYSPFFPAPLDFLGNTITVVAGSTALNLTNVRTVSGNTVTVAGSPPDTQPPSVSMTSPANGATVSRIVTLSAIASDNVGVVGVQFLANGTNLGPEVTTSPYSYSRLTTRADNGTYSIAARARDAAGNSTTSAPITITVSDRR
jgi:hypothetical protein